MGSDKTLIIHERTSDCSALGPTLSRERCDVTEASLDLTGSPLSVENNFVVTVNALASAPGACETQLSHPRNAQPASAPCSATSKRRRLVRQEPAQRKHKRRRSLKVLELGDKTVLLGARVVRGSVGEVRLTRFEYSILHDLLAHVNRTVPSEKLVRQLWPSDPTKGVHSLRAFIKNLRKKIEPDPPNPQYIVTDLAVGYRLRLSAPPSD
jgi:hypothetical protein